MREREGGGERGSGGEGQPWGESYLFSFLTQATTQDYIRAEGRERVREIIHCQIQFKIGILEKWNTLQSWYGNHRG